VRALLAIARREGMAAATLEVRVSNQPARALYREFGFHEVGVRKRYYSDNKEDAVIMTTEEFESEGFRRKLAEAEARIADVAGALASTD
jgi:ribosomal-protein-alanine N-acetyltransferase